MNVFPVIETARGGPPTNSARPATTVLVNTPDVRVVVFRFLPGQMVPMHTNKSSVLLTVLEGNGYVSGELDGVPDERACSLGDLIAYAAGEGHSMRTAEDGMILLATITPRSGERTTGV